MHMHTADMPKAEDPTAHEIIVLSRKYHLSVHFPQGSLYANVWLGIDTGTSDLLISLSEMRRSALDTTPTSELAPSTSTSSTTSTTSRSRSRSGSATIRKDSGCPPPPILPIRHSDHGLFNCPVDKNPIDWLVSKETLTEGHSICEPHHAKFHHTIERVAKLRQPGIPNLDSLQKLLDEFVDRNRRNPGPIDSPTCCICAATPYTRLFFSML
ncbi:hypothetical protein GQ54DRAFT_329159 [Martensiomyces pterosporus]|nr:hypothetical protein GQ54DRAFT_329159 [Martensiomyces pterosporus]